MKKQAIICVDDEKLVLSSLQTELIDTLGNEYLIEIAEEGEYALALFKELLEEQYEIPLVISDYIMPKMKGDELLKRIHILSPKTRKVMLTGHANTEAIGNAIHYAKLYRYLSKPWNPEDLALTVLEAIDSYWKDKQLEEKNKQLESKITTFGKFVPAQFLNLLNLQEYEHIKLGSCVERIMSVLFADIRSFTKLSEKLTPKESFFFINSYLSYMGPAIRKHNGFIDKYIGDAIMALFEDANDAVRAAIEMLSRLPTYNESRKQDGNIPISIGIGINTGHLMLGTVGEDYRMQTTVIGDMVNLASRVEDLTKIYHAPILITEHTWQDLKEPNQYAIRMIDTVVVKGKTEPATIFEVLDTIPATLNNDKIVIADLFEQALVLYRMEEFIDSGTLFEECLEQCPDDTATNIYLERIRSH